MILLPTLTPRLERLAEAWRDPRPRLRIPELAFGMLCAEHPKTVTSVLVWLGLQDQDWSWSYQALSSPTWRMHELFDPLLEDVLRLRPDPQSPLFSAQDDSLLRKTGRKMPGTFYARDPLSPPFQTDLVLGQRFLQTSMLMRVPGQQRPARSIPVSFRHTPPLKAPSRSSAEVKKQFKEAAKKKTQSHAALEELCALRLRLDRLGADSRPDQHRRRQLRQPQLPARPSRAHRGGRPLPQGRQAARLPAPRTAPRTQEIRAQAAHSRPVPQR